MHFILDLEIWVEYDTLDYVIAAILSQKHLDGILGLVGFMSKKILPTKCNYKIYDKELLAIICAFEE